MPQVLCKPVLELGTGLGNRLFPWARCLLFARRHGAAMIDPIWLRPAIGQIFRGGVDHRSYLRQLVLFGLFRANAENLSPLRGFVKSRGARVVDERAGREMMAAPASGAGGKVLVVFQGLEGFFEALRGRQEILHRELRAITRERYLRLADRIGEVPVGVCVRCGNDYSEPNNEEYAPLGPDEKTPLRWYVESLRLIRRETGRPVHAFVVSDGTREVLKPLLELENVTFVRPGAAVSDLLVLSRARVLLASGASSFAAWASFFGQMPSASHPGQPLSVWNLERSRGQFLGELDPRRPPSEFLGQAAAALAGIDG